jgi:viroplasmin and RNaseH domain-containing protein
MTTESKVYLVTHGYNDREIYAIFKTKEKAEEYCKEKNDSLEQLLQKRVAIGKSLVTRFNSEPIPSWLIDFEQRASKLL